MSDDVARAQALPHDVALVERTAHLMDEAVRIPVVGVRVGLDALVGLFPGGGDALGALVGLWAVVVAVRHHVGFPVVARMVANLPLDLAAGSVPLVGDLADVLVRAHTRNAELLVAHADLARTPRTLPGSVKALLAGLGAALVGMAVGAAWLAWWLVGALASLVR